VRVVTNNWLADSKSKVPSHAGQSSSPLTGGSAYQCIGIRCWQGKLYRCVTPLMGGVKDYFSPWSIFFHAMALIQLRPRCDSGYRVEGRRLAV
jgi:hypothetical protein